MNVPCSIRSRIAELQVSRNNWLSFGSFLFAALFFLSSCTASVPVLSFSRGPDSLAEVSKREFVAASLQYAKGEYSGAVERYRKLLTVQPDNTAIHYALSKAWAGLGLLDSARRYSEQSVVLSPGNKYYAGFLAALAHQMHDYDRAADLYRKLSVMEPGSAEPLSNAAPEYFSGERKKKKTA